MDLSTENQIVDAGEIIETPKSKNNKKILLLIFGVIFSLGLLLGFVLTSRRHTQNTSVTPTVENSNPSLVPTKIKIPSKYATSSGLLKIESDTKNIISELDNTDFSLSVLYPPPLFDLEIGF